MLFFIQKYTYICVRQVTNQLWSYGTLVQNKISPHVFCHVHTTYHCWNLLKSMWKTIFEHYLVRDEINCPLWYIGLLWVPSPPVINLEWGQISHDKMSPPISSYLCTMSQTHMYAVSIFNLDYYIFYSLLFDVIYETNIMIYGRPSTMTSKSKVHVHCNNEMCLEASN